MWPRFKTVHSITTPYHGAMFWREGGKIKTNTVCGYTGWHLIDPSRMNKSAIDSGWKGKVAVKSYLILSQSFFRLSNKSLPHLSLSRGRLDVWILKSRRLSLHEIPSRWCLDFPPHRRMPETFEKQSVVSTKCILCNPHILNLKSMNISD